MGNDDDHHHYHNNNMYTEKEEPKFSANMKLGDTIQDYTIIKLLGKGGFGHVYEAQSKLVGKKVAIKMVGLPKSSMVSTERE